MATDGKKSARPKDFVKKCCEEDSKFAFEQYTSLHHACFKLEVPRDGKHLHISTSKISRNAKDVWKDGRRRRLASGTRAPFNEDASYDIFLIADDAQPASARAIAANRACTILKRKLLPSEKQFLGQVGLGQGLF
ncbi:hypothetical protein NLJ89_g5759 [Agrocybe chaxingu]|uniref:Uncharacterized protein n=1 Tax=Agrocybe chaxingu TaxID=84603 RepID=A0A9W8MX18_9AGAR|nr:hypothetical protein NLJ89_g5759 [Agrocybe chaxingu]